MTKTKKCVLAIAVIFFIALILFVVTRGKHSIPLPVQPQEEWTSRNNDLQSRTPEKDLKEALFKNDLCFMGINEYSTVVPGIEIYYSSLPGKKCLKIIEGTGDAILSKEQGMFQDSARQYADAYNKLLLKHLESQMSPSEYGSWREKKHKLDSLIKRQHLGKGNGE